MHRWGAAAVLVVLVTGCSIGGDDDDGGREEIDGGSRSSDIDDSSIEEMLGLLPMPDMTEELRLPDVTYGDLAAAAELAGVETPDALSDPEALSAWINPITGREVGVDSGEASPVVVAEPTLPSAGHIMDSDEIADEMGWSVTDVDRFAEVSWRGDRVTPQTIYDGRFDEAKLEAALGEPSDGVWVAGNADGSLDEGTAARRVGAPWWLALDGDRLRVAGSPEEMDRLRSPASGPGTLADDVNLLALARALDDEGAYSAKLSGGPGYLGPMTGEPHDQETEERLCAASLPEMPVAFAVGIALDDGDPVIVVALAHVTRAAAESNVAGLEAVVEQGISAYEDRHWNEAFSLDEVAVDDTTVVARLRPVTVADAGLWRDVFENRETLLTSCNLP